MPSWRLTPAWILDDRSSATLRTEVVEWISSTSPSPVPIAAHPLPSALMIRHFIRRRGSPTSHAAVRVAAPPNERSATAGPATVAATPASAKCSPLPAVNAARKRRSHFNRVATSRSIAPIAFEASGRAAVATAVATAVDAAGATRPAHLPYAAR